MDIVEQLRLSAAAADRDACNELLRRHIEHHPEHEAPTCRSRREADEPIRHRTLFAWPFQAADALNSATANRDPEDNNARP